MLLFAAAAGAGGCGLSQRLTILVVEPICDRGRVGGLVDFRWQLQQIAYEYESCCDSLSTIMPLSRLASAAQDLQSAALLFLCARGMNRVSDEARGAVILFRNDQRNVVATATTQAQQQRICSRSCVRIQCIIHDTPSPVCAPPPPPAARGPPRTGRPPCETGQAAGAPAAEW